MDEMEWDKMKLQGKLIQNFLPTLIGMMVFMLVLSMFENVKRGGSNMNKLIKWLNEPVDLLKISCIAAVFFIIGGISYKFNPSVQLVYINMSIGTVSLICAYAWILKKILKKDA